MKVILSHLQKETNIEFRIEIASSTIQIHCAITYQVIIFRRNREAVQSQVRPSMQLVHMEQLN